MYGCCSSYCIRILVYILTKLFRSNEEEKKKNRDWNKISAALEFIDEKGFEEMEHEDFDRARKTIVNVLEKENIHPDKIMAIQGEIEFNFVKMVIPEIRDREIASEIEEGEMEYIKRKLKEKFNEKISSSVMDSLRDYRHLYEAEN